MRHLAAWTAGNHQRCRPPARKTRCKRSGCPCCRGLPGAIKRGAIGCARSHCVTGCARHAGPLSRLPYPGAPDGTRRRCSPWPPSPAVIARAPTRAQRSRGDEPAPSGMAGAAHRWARPAQHRRATRDGGLAPAAAWASSPLPGASGAPAAPPGAPPAAVSGGRAHGCRARVRLQGAQRPRAPPGIPRRPGIHRGDARARHRGLAAGVWDGAGGTAHARPAAPCPPRWAPPTPRRGAVFTLRPGPGPWAALLPAVASYRQRRD
jgi:hypothetical protein